MKEFLTRFLNQIGQAFWVEIKTEVPACIYYFGPFLTEQEANEEKQGYWDDLEAENAQGIQMMVKRCRPTELTITEDWGTESWQEQNGLPPSPAERSSPDE
ncbi:MAG: DUF1816 domain-containing protein [Prochlorotrichaceae cyanobacterium]|jgi:hypothetical protein